MITVISKVFSIFLIMAVGFVLYRKNVFPVAATKYFVDLLLLVTTPCMILTSITSREFDASMAVSTAQTLILTCGFFAVSAFIGWILFKTVFKKTPKQDIGVYIFGFASVNNGFMGFPVTQAIFGGDIFYLMVLHNIILSLYLYGAGPLILSMHHEGPKMDFVSLTKKMANPSIIFSIWGIIMLFCGLQLPDMIFDTVDTIGQITVPLSMLLVGMQLGDADLKHIFSNITLVLMSLIKMLALPLVTFLLVNWLPIADTVKICLIFGASFPTAVVTSAIAVIENKNSTLSAECIAVATLISLVTIPVVALFLNGYYGL